MSLKGPLVEANSSSSWGIGGPDQLREMFRREDQLGMRVGTFRQGRRGILGKPWVLTLVLMLLGLTTGSAEDITANSRQLFVFEMQLNASEAPSASPETLDQALQEAEVGDEEMQQQSETEEPTEEPQPTLKEPLLNFSSFPRCNYTTQELTQLSPEDEVQPCIVFDIQPEQLQINRTSMVTLVQVTPAGSCNNHRDGATTSVELLNQENEGRGIAVGFHKDYHIQFRLVSLIAGNSDYLGREVYGLQHAAVLRAAVTALDADYIVGSCSFASGHEKQPALDTQTMVFTQVGPPGFYKDENPYIFGVHINSDTYPIPTVRALGFQAANVGEEASTSLSKLPVRVLYRTQSEFFRSTCQSALRALNEVGFTDILDIPFDPDADDDGDGVANALDEDYLIDLADQTCPPGSGDYEKHYNPALFACVLKEQDIILNRWKENGCRPLSLWMTPATWGWAADNPTVVPYMFGGGQWHEAFKYSDRFFQSGSDMLAYNEKKFGYYGNYDGVVSYAVPMIFAEHIESFYRVIDDPDPKTDFSTDEGYEALRRAMVVLNTETIFGPLSYNGDQRNIGRGAAGTQWQTQKIDGEPVYRNVLVSPFLQAEADSKIPAPSAVNCTPGYYVNETEVLTGDAILGNKCEQCPVDTYTAVSSQQLQCHACPEGSTTDGLTGQAHCVQLDDNLLTTGSLAFGYLAVAITWMLSIGCMGWLVKNRAHPVVMLSQFEFMVLVCLGAFISTSTIIALSLQAGSDEDTDAATAGCRAVPFLYTTGWVLQYGSLSAKSFRLAKIMNTQNRIRVTVTAWETMVLVAAILAMDWIVVVTWTATYPLEYVRDVTSVEMDDATNVMTITSSGRCAIVDGPSIWAFVGPLIAIHALLMITTNVILYRVRGVADRYQEQKYVALASAFVFEVLVIGLPVILSVKDNPMAVFFVLTGIIALNDIGMLCFVFIPKIMFQRKKIEKGVKVTETILKASHKKAAVRESILRSSYNPSGVRSSFSNSVKNSGGSESFSAMKGGPDLNSSGSILDSSGSSSEFSSNPKKGSIKDLSLSNGSVFESIMEGSCEDDSEHEHSQLNQDHARRKSAATPQTLTEEEDGTGTGEEGGGLDMNDIVYLKDRLEEAQLKNYSLELNLEELRGSEGKLLKRVAELESLLAPKEEGPLNDSNIETGTGNKQTRLYEIDETPPLTEELHSNFEFKRFEATRKSLHAGWKERSRDVGVSFQLP